MCKLNLKTCSVSDAFFVVGKILKVPAFCSSTNMLAMPLESGSMEAKRITEQKHCATENRGCGPCSDLYLQRLAWAKTTEARTGVEFPTMLDSSISGESNSGFTPEVAFYLNSEICECSKV